MRPGSVPSGFSGGAVVAVLSLPAVAFFLQSKGSGKLGEITLLFFPTMLALSPGVWNIVQDPPYTVEFFGVPDGPEINPFKITLEPSIFPTNSESVHSTAATTVV